MQSDDWPGTSEQVVRELEWFELDRPAPPLPEDCLAQASEELARMGERVTVGSRVGVGVGSRGISRIADVVGAVVRVLVSRGAEPVLIPAMASHGGATPDGQVHIIHELGVDERLLNVPVDASMEVQQIGTLTGGAPVFLSKAALACDAFVPINRVKPHTDFRAPVESGLTKMLTIGLGKERGATVLHAAGFEAFVDVLPEALEVVLGRLSVPFGVALLEDEWHRLRRVEVVPGEVVLERDRALLLEAWDHFARLPFGQLDALVLRESGKVISGAGMDPNVTGRFPNKPLAAGIVVQRLTVLDLAGSSPGNAIGIGVADVATERLRSKIDWAATYANAQASRSLAGAKLPFVAGTDSQALALTIGSLTGATQAVPKVVVMKNTLEVNHIAVTRPLVATAKAAGYASLGPPVHAQFDQEGNLLRIGTLEFFSGKGGSATA